MKINLLFVITFLSLIIYANIDHEHGQIGVTKRDGGLGCQCHGTTPTDSVIVWIEGPDTVFVGDTTRYKLLMTGGPSVAGGFDLASYFGDLDSTDTLTHVLFGELTHTDPNPFFNDTVSWNFSYTAPDSFTTDTIYSVANSVNWNGNPVFDQWNFGQNFVIHIIDNPVNTETGDLLPEDFVLHQNYPNPFNPSTTLSFVISNSSFVSLKVYDILGNEVAVLVNEDLAPGEYKVEFNINSGESRNLTSGVYFYQLKLKGPESSSPQGQAGQGFVETKKMILLK
jgi:hypothetical protein